jgi:uncharacterized protein
MTEPGADARTADVRTTPETRTLDVRTLIEQIAKSLVDAPDEVLVYQVEEEGETVIELEVAPDDMGKVIGKHGRTVRALRCLVNATGIRSQKRYALEILE